MGARLMNIPKFRLFSLNFQGIFLLYNFYSFFKGLNLYRRKKSQKKRTKNWYFRNSIFPNKATTEQEESNIYPTGINITIPERNQEAALYPQELTSALLIQKLSRVHLHRAGPLWGLTGNTSHDCQSLQ